MKPSEVVVRNTRPGDVAGIIGLTRSVYPTSPPWTEKQLASHLAVFPEGQFVAVDEKAGRVVGMTASLIVYWDDYDIDTSWRDFTDHGMFTNHDPDRGRTLYAAEAMVHPEAQGTGVGSRLYDARRQLAYHLALRRIRAGARLRGYHRYADRMTAVEYAMAVSREEIRDPTVSFQLHRGFRIVAVVPGYLHHDPESLGYAAIIEWRNPKVPDPADAPLPDPRFDPGRGR